MSDMNDNKDATPEDDEKARFNRVHQGDEIDVTAMAPGMRSIMIGLGWDVIGFDSDAADLDASLFLLNKEELTREDEDFIFYNNLTSKDGAVEHTGDNRTGAGDGDDETVFIELDKIPYDVTKLAFVVSLYDAESRGHSFRDVRNVFFRVVDSETNRELFRYFMDGELQENTHATAVRVGFLVRDGGKWVFEAEGAMIEGGLARLATNYGIIVAGV